MLLSQEDSKQLLRETAALVALERDYAVSLDFGGTSTQQVRPVGRHPDKSAAEQPADPSSTHVQASQALKRASRGGMLAGLQLASISSLLIGASRLKRAIQGAVRSAEDSGASASFQPLVDAIKVCSCRTMATGWGPWRFDARDAGRAAAVLFPSEVFEITALACSCSSVQLSRACLIHCHAMHARCCRCCRWPSDLPGCRSAVEGHVRELSLDCCFHHRNSVAASCCCRVHTDAAC